jgi:uncharacterized membrane protein
MRRWMIAAALMALPVESWAGTLECQFTEPFFTISFDSRTGTVTEISADVTDPDTGKPIPRILAEGARLRVVNPDGDGLTLRLEKGDQWIMQLRLTGQGSDGMSESIYPFEATLGTNIGGCATGKYPAFRTYDMLEDLGASL